MKKILITGASSEMGKKLANHFVKKNYQLTLVSRDSKKFNNLIKKNRNKKLRYFKIDLNNLSSLEENIQIIFNKSKYDGLIHCAGEHIYKPLRTVLKKDIVNSFNVNIISPIILTREFIKKDNYKDNASIIFISSSAAIKGNAMTSIYSSSKASQIGFVKSLAAEISANKKIRINAILPSLIKSKITDKILKTMNNDEISNLKKRHLLGFGDYNDIIDMVEYLMSSKGKWITGSCFNIDGGYSI